MKKNILPFILCITLLTECWDKKELNDLAIVLALGLDKDPATEEIIMSAQVVRPKALQADSGTSKNEPTDIIAAKGKTIFDARMNMLKKFDREPFFSHYRTLIITERVAKDGVATIFDRLVRSNETRPLIDIIIAKDASPEEIMSVDHGISEIQALYLKNIIDLRKTHSEANVTYLQQFVEEMLSESGNPTAGVMEVVKSSASSTAPTKVSNIKEIKLTGTAVFNKDTLAGYLTDEETKGLNWILGKIKKGSVVFSSPTPDDKLITTNIKKVKSQIKVERKDGEFIFNIKINETAEIAEQHDLSDSSEPKTIELIEREQEEKIRKQVKTTIEKVQNDIKVDVLGFGTALSKQYPKEWEKVKDNWDDMFPKMSYTVTVDSRIVRTGLLLKPIRVKK